MSAAVRGDHASVQFFLQEGADVETEIMKHGLLVRLAAERDYASLRSLLEMSYVTPSQMLQEVILLVSANCYNIMILRIAFVVKIVYTTYWMLYIFAVHNIFECFEPTYLSALYQFYA